MVELDMVGLAERVIFYMGMVLVVIGALCDLVASIGIVRFPNFYVRLHAATVGIIGGAVTPLIGLALISLVSSQFGVYRYGMACIAFITAIVIMIVAPTGTHILAYAAHKSKTVPVEPKVVDKLEERERRYS